MAEDQAPESGAEEEPLQAPEHLRLVRIVDRFIHSSARARTRELEFHVRNDTQKAFSFLYLPLPNFVQNLRVHDEDDRRLNVALNSEVKEVLSELSQENPAAYQFFQLRFKDVKYRLGVFFPPDALLRPNSTRIVTLRFEDDDPVQLAPIMKSKRHFSFGLFTVPLFRAEKARFPGHEYEYFFVVLGPTGYAIDWESGVQGTKPSKNIYETGKKATGRVLSVRLPPAETAPYTWAINYELRPGRKGSVSMLNTFFLSSVLAGIISAVAFVWHPFWLPVEPISVAAQAINGALAATSLAMLYAITDEWAERYKTALLIPILANAAAWAMWLSL